ncbi:MAG: MurT ligase domain-containing protein [Candidatus Caenarcaniphilales bacterium]|nr:MurT ligase domain-containing protein [Candidatus Caenarcaniphilales bacterium]
MDSRLKWRERLAYRIGRQISKFLGSDSTSAPGLAALKLAPNLLTSLLKPLGESTEAPIFITGTNGKSTTAGILAQIMTLAGQEPLHNLSGANLASGLTTVFLKNYELDELSEIQPPMLFEIDEAYLRQITPLSKARQIIVTNFFRDQLDRFGELDHTIALVQAGLHLIAGGPLLTNADDPNACKLKTARTFYFGIDPMVWQERSLSETYAAELASCPVCDHELSYRERWLGQLGDFYCEGCDYKRPDPEVRVIELDLGIHRSRILVRFPYGAVLETFVPLPGLFNVYNALAAITSAYHQGISPAIIKEGVESYRPLFGRSQKVEYLGRTLRLFLIKNPIGASEVLRLLASESEASLLIAINDNYADGRDVSWLWDAHFECLSQIPHPVHVSGTRASDMAVRLKYAGMNRIHYHRELKEALKVFCQQPADRRLFILPTYTALLELTEILGLSKS